MTEEEKKIAKAAAQKRWYEKNKARHAANTAKRSKLHREVAREHVQKLKEASPCTDCGNHFPHYVMQWDHLGDKKMDVSRMVQSGNSIETIEKEIAKCELVCANCHCIRTHNRRQ
ncbi:HNH endonuclease [Streptomyces phage Bordeaux]|uniref:HNH endonuclease n=1 Tax=Streptomyces phage Bordeaux TaxID=2653769 RepID=A0A5Q2WQH2_9CAUD|nr:HNH endonuclease [Streptomyces phage Bordeaux]